MEHSNADDVLAFCLYLMNKMHRNLINVCVEYIKHNRFDGLINDFMPYFKLVAAMVGITGLTGFSYFWKMMYLFCVTMMS